MKTIVINNQKGGVGKTLMAVHLAWFLAEDGARVAFIDFDPQANGTYTLSGERSGGPASALFFGKTPTITTGEAGITVFGADPQLSNVDAKMAEAVTTMRTNYAALAEAFDYAVIDTPPTWGGRNYAALMVADHLLSPIDLEGYSIMGVDTLRKQIKLVEQQARNGRPIDFMGLLASRYQSGSPRQKMNLETLFKSARALLFDGVITQRQGYAEALASKVPVWTLKKTAAQEAGREIRIVLERIKTRINKPADQGVKA